MTLVEPLLTLLVLLIPWIIKWVDEHKPIHEREKFDALLVTGDPLDVAAELSELYDKTYDSAGQSDADLHRGESKTL